jgi:transaldolase/glucose-6-phosphate isomerase
VNTNITLLFAISAYEGGAEGYLRGLERRLEAGRPLNNVASVASFFVSRMDTLVDGMLPADSPLRGRAVVANARKAYRRFKEIFAGDRWERLARNGGHVQRPLWASTSTKNPEYSDVLYVRELIAPNTVNTMPETTLHAVLDHLEVSPTIEPNLDEAGRVTRELVAAGIDIDAVTAKLLVDGLAGFQKDFDALLGGVAKSVAAARVGRWDDKASLGELQIKVERRLEQLEKEDVVGRIWRRDHTVWKPDPTEIANRLDWLSLPETMKEHAAELSQFARDVWGDGYTTAVLLGMGGSSLAPEVLQTTPRPSQSGLSLKVLDTTDPDQIAGVEAEIDLERTLFIVASKSGATIETTSQFAYFWERIPDGRHFIAITDPGTPLETSAGEHSFRKVFSNPPDIGGRYSALSYFGLVPAALMGIDVVELLARPRNDGLRSRRFGGRQPGRLAGNDSRRRCARRPEQAHTRDAWGDVRSRVLD